jgi:nucleoside-diphosphate-sugar epimerase
MTDTETVLVTGGTGFIGSYLAQALVEDGHEVVAFDASTDATRLERLGVADAVRVIQGDVAETDALSRAIRETDVTRVVHMAALLSEAVRTDPLTATRVNAVGTNAVLEAARSFPDRIERVVVTSSETVYAPGSAYDGPVSEDALLCPDSPYSAAKRYGECLARQYREEYDVPALALRPTGVFGPLSESFTAYADLFAKPALGDDVRVEGGATLVSWLYVKDAADAFRRATLAPASALTHDVYNVAGEAATVATAAKAVRETVDDATVEVVDDTDADWAAQRLSLSRARADLGYEVSYDLSTLVRDYVDEVRRGAGRPSLERE